MTQLAWLFYRFLNKSFHKVSCLYALVVVVCLVFCPKLSYKLHLIASYEFRQALDLYPYLVITVFWKALVLLLTYYTMLGV